MRGHLGPAALLRMRRTTSKSLWVGLCSGPRIRRLSANARALRENGGSSGKRNGSSEITRGLPFATRARPMMRGARRASLARPKFFDLRAARAVRGRRRGPAGRCYRRGMRMELERDDLPVEDHFVQLDGATWADYERLLELRGDRSAPRLTYLEGVLEIMSPSRDHERIKTLIGRLVEAFCLARDIPVMAYGAWTLKRKKKRRGAEPDECYVFGDEPATRPHLAIEVVWTSGGLDKLEVYRKLGVGEVWHWQGGRLTVHVLRDEEYVEAPRSERLPGIDLELLARFLDRSTINVAVRDYLAALRARP